MPKRPAAENKEDHDPAVVGNRIEVGFGSKLTCAKHPEQPLRTLYTQRRHKGVKGSRFAATSWRLCDKCGRPVKVTMGVRVVDRV